MNKRVTGFDLARALAIFGMVMLNYKIVMNATTGSEFLLWFFDLFVGRASALFVMLAGVGIALITKKARESKDRDEVLKSQRNLIKRGLLLIVIGLAYTPLWEGDILHFYGFYFLIAAPLFMFSNRTLLWIASFFVLLFPVLMFFFNYDQGWDWTTLAYEDFWTFNGMVRNLMFNGFHPVFPWTAFLIFGMWLGRKDLSQTRLRNNLLIWSLIVLVVTEAVFYLIRTRFGGEMSYLFYTSVMPPMPQYVLSAGSSALIVIIASLYFSERFSESKLNKWLCQTGRLSLTLYIAHVVIGMELLNSIGRLEDQTINFSMFSAFVFCVCGVLYSVLWFKYFKVGPLEWCFRKIAS